MINMLRAKGKKIYSNRFGFDLALFYNILSYDATYNPFFEDERSNGPGSNTDVFLCSISIILF